MPTDTYITGVSLCTFSPASRFASSSLAPRSRSFSSLSVSRMFDRKSVAKTDNPAHGTSEIKLHREPCWNAFLTAVCTSGGSESMLCKDEIPDVRPLASSEASAAERLPEVIMLVMMELTFALRTAPHWARPTVPPRARLYKIGETGQKVCQYHMEGRLTKRPSAETTATRLSGWEKRQWIASGPIDMPTPTPAMTRKLQKAVRYGGLLENHKLTHRRKPCC